MIETAFRTGTTLLRRRAAGARKPRPLAWDERGAVIVEAAFALPLLLMLLMGIVTYGLWLTAASTLQQVANEGARSVLGGMNAGERQTLLDRTIDASLLNSGLIERDLVEVEAQEDAGFFTVTLSYDMSSHVIFSRSLLPLPGNTIVRSATVEVGGI